MVIIYRKKFEIKQQGHNVQKNINIKQKCHTRKMNESLKPTTGIR